MRQLLRYSSRRVGSSLRWLGIAEAIEASMMHSHFVTVPILDARLQELKAETRIALMGLEGKLSASVQELKAEMERNKAELVRWVFLVMLGNVALSAGATALLNAFKHLG
jgi:hypothetical protein